MSDESLKKAVRTSVRINFLAYFCTNPWIKNKPNRFYTEFTEGFYGNKMIITDGLYTFKWRDYQKYLIYYLLAPIFTIDVSGPATLAIDIAGINLSNALATLNEESKTIVICYNCSTINNNVKLIYKSVTYNIPVVLGLNYLGISIGLYSITVLGPNGTSYINIMISDEGAPETYTLEVRNLNLYGLNTFNLLDNTDLQTECDLIKSSALKRVL